MGPGGRSRPPPRGRRGGRIAGTTGLPTGPARRLADGRYSLEVDGGQLVVLQGVAGRGLTGETPQDAERIGAALAQAHRVTVGHDVPGAWQFPWVDADATPLQVDPEVRAAVADAVRAVEAIRPGELTTGVAHGDPAPEAFLLDGDRVGLIDWGSCVNGPLLYDLVTAAMYLGGLPSATSLFTAYAEADGPVSGREIETHAESLLRWRWAVQADYFAGRIAEDDRTGLASGLGNQRGFADARQRLLAAR